jgi:predicted double-glycine peptidase
MIAIEKIRTRMQATPYTCGLASLRIVFSYYGVNVHEAELVTAGEVTEEGTAPDKMKAIARHFGFTWYSRSDSSIAEVRRWLLRECPVIVLMQAWGRNDGRSGHYVVITGLGSDSVLLADPSAQFQRTVPMSRFLARWWDVDDKVLRHWFAVVRPK